MVRFENYVNSDIVDGSVQNIDIIWVVGNLMEQNCPLGDI